MRRSLASRCRHGQAHLSPTSADTNDGAIPGTTQRIYLMPGEQIDRYGSFGGRYFAPTGTPMEMRALPYNANLLMYTQFEVVKPFEVISSTIAPAFGQIGFGTQYLSPVSAQTLVDKGIIMVVG